MRPASEWREAPYPGERPATSFIQVDDVVLMLQEDLTGATVGGTDLDAWLLGRGEQPMADRTPVLSYGSNACPSKLVRMRDQYRLTGSVVMTACTVEGWAAAWCDGYRRDGVVPATLVEAPGIEEHFLWWVDAAQWAALNACEGAPSRYELQPVLGTVRTTDGTVVVGVQAYVGVAPNRLPRLDEFGAPVLVRERAPANAQGQA